MTTISQPANHEAFTTLADLNEPFVWTGGGRIPDIGASVRVLMDDLGRGTVEAYILAESNQGSVRCLGVRVQLDAPPKHSPPQLEAQGRKAPIITAFGMELEALADTRPSLRLPLQVISQAQTLRLSQEGPAELDVYIPAVAQVLAQTPLPDLVLVVHHDGRVELEGARALYEKARVVDQEAFEGLRQFQMFLHALEGGTDLDVCEISTELNVQYLFKVDGQPFTWPRSTLMAFDAVGRAWEMQGADPEFGDLRLFGPAAVARTQVQPLVAFIELEMLGEAMLWPHAPVLQAFSPQTRTQVEAILTGPQVANEVLSALLPSNTWRTIQI